MNGVRGTEMDESARALSSARKTIYDIAKRSGVSPATVSRYLNNTSNVSAALRQRIALAIEEFDYHPSQVARALAGRRTGVVVLAVPNIDNPRWPEVARALESRLADAGLSLVLINLGAGRERELAGLDRVYRMRAEALAISMLTYEPGDFGRLQRAGTHIVSVSNDIIDPTIDAVLPDRLTAVHLAIEHLAGLGHRRIAYIDGPIRLPGVRARIAAYRQARTKADLAMEPEQIIHVPEPTSANRGEFVRAVLDTRATAAVAANDAWAIDLWMGLEQAGLQVPRDCSIIGMDDIPAAALVRTGLTTLALDRAARGRLAADLLIERVTGTGSEAARQLSIPPRLVVRSSTVPPAVVDGSAARLRTRTRPRQAKKTPVAVGPLT
ncbi:MAG: LacI family transcriptional regulator [Chloroflexota bacterium]|nr:LacI family transcriptional regulator [Chloroflexota bacterium]